MRRTRIRIPSFPRALHAHAGRQGWRFQTSRFFYRRRRPVADVPHCGVKLFPRCGRTQCAASRRKKIGRPDRSGKITGTEKRRSDGSHAGPNISCGLDCAGLPAGSGQAALDCQSHQFGGCTHAELLAHNGRCIGNRLVRCMYQPRDLGKTFSCAEQTQYLDLARRQF